MSKHFRTIEEYGIIPVINIPKPELAKPLAKALEKAGLPIIEVTMRNDSATESLSQIKKNCPGVLVGAGTVLSIELAKQVMEAGADFIVTPGLNQNVVEFCLKQGVEVFPGCATPTEIEAGLSMSLNRFKFFPAEQLGGLKTIRELCGPYRSIKFIATSGINLNNLEDYLSCECIAAVGGSFMAPAELVMAEKFEEITALCRSAVRKSLGFHIMHVGINGKDADEGSQRARRFADIFDLPYKRGHKSDFAGTILESGNMKFPGELGHIAIGTNSVERAKTYLQRKGVSFREEFKKVDEQGKMVAVYLEEEIGGFAVHLLRKH